MVTLGTAGAVAHTQALWPGLQFMSLRLSATLCLHHSLRLGLGLGLRLHLGHRWAPGFYPLLPTSIPYLVLSWSVGRRAFDFRFRVVCV